MGVIYLDNAATSWPKPECVYQAVDRSGREIAGSPGRGSHRFSIQAGMLLLETREALAGLFNVSDSSGIVFTANATMAINTALQGLLNPGDRVVISGMEHNALVRPLTLLKSKGVELAVVPCASDGTLDPHDLETALSERKTRLVALQHASNVTGTIMPLAEAGRIAHRHGALLLVDAAQSAGILPIDVENQQIDLLAFTGHKGLLGPQGTGGLYIRPGLQLRPLMAGGTGSHSEKMEQPDVLPDRFESGTPNTPGLIGLGAGVKYLLETGIDKIRKHEQELTEMLLTGLSGIRGVTLYGPMTLERRTAVISFNVEGIDAGEMSMMLDRNFAVITRSGLHCAPLAHRTIGTIDRGTCRLSPGWFNTEAEMEQVIEAIDRLSRGLS